MRRLNLSIQTLFIFLSCLVILVLFPTIGFYILNKDSVFRDTIMHQTVKEMRHSLESRSSTLVRSMALSAGHALATNESKILNELLYEVAASDKEIIYAIVMDSNMQAISHSTPEMVGKFLNDDIDYYAQEILDRSLRSSDNLTPHTFATAFIDEFTPGKEGAEPVMEALLPIVYEQKIYGLMRCGYSLSAFHEQLSHVEQDWQAKNQRHKENFLRMTAIFLFISIIVAFAVTKFLLHELKILQNGVDHITHDDLDHVIDITNLSCAEMKNLGHAFNVMVQRLKESRLELANHGTFLEETVQERTEELEVANKNLAQQAHESGMAEMAVGILHNIGNAITPAKVGSDLLIQQLQKSPTKEQLNQTMSQMANVIRNDQNMDESERDRLLSLTNILPQVIATERENLAWELEKIAQKHNHIAETIDLQMRYANLIGESTEVDLNEMVNDAINMLGTAIHKQTVTIERNMGDIPQVRIDKAKLMQVLINLIKNAYEAMAETPKRVLTITTSFEDKDGARVMLFVKDSGIGFKPEESEKIFAYGYTSKKRGSGFGLHSSANFLIAHKGNIKAISDGPGTGATFIVSLMPYHGPVTGNG